MNEQKATKHDLFGAWLILGAGIALCSAIYFLNEMIKVAG